MLIQQLTVGLIVVACALQAAWALMPGALRQRVLKRLGRASAAPAAGCGSACGGCSQAARPAAAVLAAGPGAPSEAKPVVFHPRRPH